MNKTIEIHPNWPHDTQNIRSLILGTFPPGEHRRNYDFFYPNKNNKFWKVMATLAETSLTHFSGVEAVEERKAILKKLSTGLDDVAAKIERENKSAADRKIKILEFRDIIKIINETPTLKNILLTGYSGKTSAYTDFRKYLNENKIEYHLPKIIRGGSSFNIKVKERDITIWICNSTSSNAFGISQETLVEQFRKAIFA